MSAPGQLSMFEPEGETLARLAARHASDAERLARAAEAWNVKGFTGTATILQRQAHQAEEQAFICEVALQLEHLGGCV